jgi:hypothetical protein
MVRGSCQTSLVFFVHTLRLGETVMRDWISLHSSTVGPKKKRCNKKRRLSRLSWKHNGFTSCAVQQDFCCCCSRSTTNLCRRAYCWNARRHREQAKQYIFLVLYCIIVPLVIHFGCCFCDFVVAFIRAARARWNHRPESVSNGQMHRSQNLP